MTTYLALLRGINVGSANRIRMEDLRRFFELAGCLNVETYIQSGNVLFDSAGDEPAIIQATESALFSGAGIRTNVVLRSAEEFRSAVSRLPFSADEIAAAAAKNTEGENLYLLFAAKPPAPEALENVNRLAPSSDLFRVLGRDVYLLLSQSIRASRTAAQLQNALSPVTVRNWNTALQLLARIDAR